MKAQFTGLVFMLSLAVAGHAGAAAGNKALEVPPQVKAPMTKQAFEAGQDAIERKYRADRKLCERLRGNAKEVCQAQAKGHRKAELALLEARYKRDPDALERARFAAADANYQVAREKCAALKGDAEDRCIDHAKAAREAARRHARVEKVDSTGGIFGEGAADKAPPKGPKS